MYVGVSASRDLVDGTCGADAAVADFFFPVISDIICQIRDRY